MMVDRLDKWVFSGIWLSPISLTPRANIHANKMSFINVIINLCKINIIRFLYCNVAQRTFQIGIFHEYISVLFCFWLFFFCLIRKERILIVIQLSIPMSSPRKTDYNADSHIEDSSYILRLSHLWNNGDIRQ